MKEEKYLYLYIQFWEKNVLQCQFIHHKPYINCSGTELWPTEKKAVQVILAEGPSIINILKELSRLQKIYIPSSIISKLRLYSCLGTTYYGLAEKHVATVQF
jgi:hypothetical protein